MKLYTIRIIITNLYTHDFCYDRIFVKRLKQIRVVGKYILSERKVFIFVITSYNHLTQVLLTTMRDQCYLNKLFKNRSCICLTNIHFIIYI